MLSRDLVPDRRDSLQRFLELQFAELRSYRGDQYRFLTAVAALLAAVGAGVIVLATREPGIVPHLPRFARIGGVSLIGAISAAGALFILENARGSSGSMQTIIRLQDHLALAGMISPVALRRWRARTGWWWLNPFRARWTWLLIVMISALGGLAAGALWFLLP